LSPESEKCTACNSGYRRYEDIMTAATPDLHLLNLARPKRSARHLLPPGATDASGDRIFVTLLSLNFMLLAFFVVLGTTATIDQSHARSVAHNVRVVFAGDHADTEITKAKLDVRQALQVGVSEALSSLLPALRRFSIDNSDRVDVEVPLALFSAESAAAERESTYDNVAGLLQNAPPGYRYALLIRGGSAESFDFVSALVARGVPPRDLLVAPAATEGLRQPDARQASAHLSMSFMVFEGDSDVEPWGMRALQVAEPSAEGKP